MSVIQSVVRSHSNSPNPCSFCTYEIRPNNSLYFQHLQNSSDLFIPKLLKVPLKSTLTSCLSLTPPESTLTKKGGEGVEADDYCLPRAISRGVNEPDSPRPLSPPISYSRESAPCPRPAAHTRLPVSSPLALPSSAPLQTPACPAPSIPFLSASARPIGLRKRGQPRPHKTQCRARISPAIPPPPEAAFPDIRHPRRGHPNSNPHSTAACAPDSCSTDESKS